MERYAGTPLDPTEHAKDGGFGVVSLSDVSDAVDAILVIGIRGLPFQRSGA